MYAGIDISDSLYNLAVFFQYWRIMMRYIPLDAIVQLETSKIVYSHLMEWDMQMSSVDPETGQLSMCQVQSMQLLENLGQVNQIFCDKTGTLTQNDLDIRAITVNGIVCTGDSRESINEAIDQTCDVEAVQRLMLCFCLCNEIKVVGSEQEVSDEL